MLVYVELNFFHNSNFVYTVDQLDYRKIKKKLSQSVLLFSCRPIIGQLCLGGPGYSSHTIILMSPGEKVKLGKHIWVDLEKVFL